MLPNRYPGWWTVCWLPLDREAFCPLGSQAEELVEVPAGNDAAPAGPSHKQVPAAHLVVQQVAGQPGQAGGLVN